MGKKWYLSKTLWVNAIGVLIEFAQLALNQNWFPAGSVTAVLAVLNMLLRLITNEKLVK